MNNEYSETNCGYISITEDDWKEIRKMHRRSKWQKLLRFFGIRRYGAN